MDPEKLNRNPWGRGRKKKKKIIIETELGASPQTHWIRNSGRGPSNLFEQALQVILVWTKV